MKSISRTMRLRFNLLMTVLICSVTAVFLLYPDTSSMPKQSAYLDRISGAAADNTLAADELAPYIYAINVPEIERKNAAWSMEAEDTILPAGAHIGWNRDGYSGIGYVSNLSEQMENAIAFSVDVPATQHYSVTICAASDSEVTNAIRINDNLLCPFTLDGNDGFVRVTFYGVFLASGNNTIAIDTVDGGLDLDYIELNDDSTVYDNTFRISPSLSNAGASEETKALYQFLCDQWGSQILTGQYVSDASNKELNLIYSMTGQLPAIRFSAVGTEDDLPQIEAAIDWHLYQGGIVGLMWQWNAPGTDSVYAEDTDFVLSHALRNVDVKQLSQVTYEEAERAAESGSIMPDTLQLLYDIDEIAAKLTYFKNMNIPVLWRPLYEASGGWYWWGAFGEETYSVLWELVYYRLTDYHALDNLIWIWNGQSETYLVPSDAYDIASVDVYLQPEMEYGSRYEQYQSLARITNGEKLLALSECSALPDQEMMQLDRSLWSFYGLWYGEYLMHPDGTFSDTYYSSSDLYNLYNSELALSLHDFVTIYP